MFGYVMVNQSWGHKQDTLPVHTDLAVSKENCPTVDRRYRVFPRVRATEVTPVKPTRLLHGL